MTVRILSHFAASLRENAMQKPSAIHKLKIVFIGTTGAGKSSLANLIADATENNEEYRPTVGVRILEFETSNLIVQNKNVKAEVELWDCSGNRRYESCWPAFRQDAQGVVLVTDPSQGSQAELSKQLETYFDYFVQQPGLNPSCCLVLVTTRQNVPLGKVPQLLSNTKVQHYTVDMDDDGNKLKSNFSLFLATVLNSNRSGTEDINFGV